VQGLRGRSRRLQGCVPPAGRGSERRDSAPAGSRSRDQRKRTESISPPSNSPDRPPPKRLPGGRAFNLRRSVLGALGKLLSHSSDVKHRLETTCRKLRQSSLSPHSLTNSGPDRSAPRAAAPSSGLPTDRRQSDCLLEGHQPRALRSSVQGGHYDPVIASSRRYRSQKIRSLRPFPFAQHKFASRRVCSRRERTMISPSRVRFRPPPRLTFRFRVRPPGRASS
jgi:hypothetical protein